jgi:adenylate cyclase
MNARHHTFLFTDLVGFTSLAVERGDDHAAEVATELQRRVRALLGSHRAEEIKTLGDGLMLRSEDPALALQLGVRVVGDLQELDGFPPVRVGIHTGPAAHRDGDWYGTTVNVAARLCGAAAGGEVLASEATCEAADQLPRLRLDDIRLHWLRNVTEPVHARVVSPQPYHLERLRLKRRRNVACGPHAQAAVT